MYCSLDKIDVSATVGAGDASRPVALQTDHRSTREIEDEPELSVLFAMARVLNARTHLVAEGHLAGDVHYVVADEPPPLLREALAATGAVLEHVDDRLERLGGPSETTAGVIADRAFAALARRAAARVGVRDLAIALRMLEDQTFAAPPEREDEPAYWRRVLELAALTGELLRAKHPDAGRWVQTDRALVPFGFQVAGGDGATVMFPTNRAQRAVEDGRDESLFKLLLAAEEALERPPDAATGRLMPSLRARETVELDELIWSPLLDDDDDDASALLPIIVCGVDGESTFGMIRRDAYQGEAAEAVDVALANLAEEAVTIEELHADDMVLLVVSGSFYAAEKLLDEAFMRGLHADLDARLIAAATPARGLLLVTGADDPTRLPRFARLVRLRYDDSGGRAISPAVVLIEDGVLAGYVRPTAPARSETATIRADTAQETPRRPGSGRK